MTRNDDSGEVEFCPDAMLDYERARTRFAAGSALTLDEQYRFAHLPLVAPDHRDVIAARDGYSHGVHARVTSLVMPVPWRALYSAHSFVELDAELRASPFAPRIAWDLLDRRRKRLHATLCGSLAMTPRGSPIITQQQRGALADVGLIEVELRGLFSGTVNLGRLYLKGYPERRDGANPFHRIQRILGRRETSLYLVGMYNLTDHLTLVETGTLATLIERWWNRPILRLTISALWLIWAKDDLVLDGGVAGQVPLRAGSLD